MHESTWKILKLDLKTRGIFSSKRVGTLSHLQFVIAVVVSVNVALVLLYHYYWMVSATGEATVLPG